MPDAMMLCCSCHHEGVVACSEITVDPELVNYPITQTKNKKLSILNVISLCLLQTQQTHIGSGMVGGGVDFLATREGEGNPFSR